MIEHIYKLLQKELYNIPIWIFVAFTLGLIICFLLGFIIGNLKNKYTINQQVKKERKDAIYRSRSVIKGQVAEQLAPFLPNFPANPTEVRFIGKPLDFVAFNGLSDGSIEDISFIEIKTGLSELSPIEKSLKEAVRKGKIKYIEYRIN